MTRKQLILDLLIKARLRDNKVIDGWLLHDDPDPNKQVWISGGFRPLYYFRGPDRGGDAADVRLRELKRDPEIYEDGHGVPIEMRIHRWRLWNYKEGKWINKYTPIYRINLTPEEILAYDWTPAWDEPFNWIYRPMNGQIAYNPVVFQETEEGQLTFV